MAAAQWQTLLATSSEHWAAGRESKREAGEFLWLGTKAAVKAWRPSTDLIGERLYRRTLMALGGSRKGCASKIKTVSLATQAYGLDLNAYGSLGAAYDAAHRMALGLEADPSPICTCPYCPGHKKDKTQP